MCPALGNKLGNKFKNFAQNHHGRLVECLLEAEFYYLRDEKRTLRKYELLGVLGPISKFGNSSQCKPFACNSIQNNHMGLVKVLMEVEFNYLHDEFKFSFLSCYCI